MSVVNALNNQFHAEWTRSEPNQLTSEHSE